VRFYHLGNSCQQKIDRIGEIMPRDGGPIDSYWSENAVLGSQHAAEAQIS